MGDLKEGGEAVSKKRGKRSEKKTEEKTEKKTERPVTTRITKANALIKASYRLTLEEQRLIMACLSQINPKETVPQKITVFADDYARQFGLCKKSAYSQLRDVSKGFYERDILLQDPGKKRRTHLRWVQQVDYFDGGGRVDLYFSDKIKAYLGQLSGDFSSYFIDHVAGLSSNYSIRLYEMIAQWSDIKDEIDIPLAEFRDRLQITDKYHAFDNLRRRVIVPALKDLNQRSNLDIVWVSILRGRKVIGLRFRFKEKRDRLSIAV
jgi:plasmid replication initiation protein